MKRRIVTLVLGWSVAVTPTLAWADDVASEGGGLNKLQATEVVISHFDEADLEDELSVGAEGLTSAEAKAVDQYLESLAGHEVLTTADDVQAGTVSGDQGVETVVVAPASVVPTKADVAVNPENGQASAGISWAPDALSTLTSGPGMGGYQNWSDQAFYRLELRLYIDKGSSNDYLGMAEFETQARRNRKDDGSLGNKWQIKRWALATPQTFLGSDVHVQKLWISNDPVKEGKVKGWIMTGEGGTRPQQTEEICAAGATFEVSKGPVGLSFPIKGDCEEYQVWRGSKPDQGHYRIAVDQGKWTSKGTRKIAYTAGYEMEAGVSGVNEFYEFVTLKPFYPAQADYITPKHKCRHDGKGSKGTQVLTCKWSYRDYSPSEKWGK